MNIVTISGKIGSPSSYTSGIGKYENEVVKRLRCLHTVHTIEYDTYRFDYQKRTINILFQLIYKVLFSISIPFRIPRSDVVHVLSQEYAYTLFFLPRRRTILTVHDVIPFRHSDATNFLFRWYELLNLRGIRRAQHIITDSKYTERELTQHLHIDPHRITVVHPGVAEHYCAYTLEDVQRFVRMKHLPEHFILYVGSDRPRKNVDVLIEAFAKARERIFDLHLVLVGRSEHGPTRQKIEQLVEERGLETFVHQFRNVPEEELPLFYNAAAATIFPSSREGFGWPPLEAFACDCPVVATKETSLAEILGDAAYTVAARDEKALAEAICSVVKDGSVQEKLVSRGREQVRRFTWEETMRGIKDVYEVKVLSAKN